MKKCGTCGKNKPDSDFYKRLKKKCGLDSDCKKCKNMKMKLRRKKNPEKAMLVIARNNAKTYGYDFDLTKEDIKIPQYCPLLGVKIDRNTYGDGRKDNCPSLDRIDPTQGYTKDNIRVISWKANRLKSNASSAELFRLGMNIFKYIFEGKKISINIISYRKQLADVDGIFSKYLIDALVSNHILENDSLKIVTKVTHSQVKISKGEKEKTIVEIWEIADEDTD